MKHIALIVLAVTILAGCEQPNAPKPNAKPETPCVTKTPVVPVVPVAEEPCVTPGQTGNAKPNINKKEKRIWATSYLWVAAPKFVVEGWINREAAPSTKKKYVLIEFWNTWCPPCRRSLAKLQHWHDKYGKDLTVIAVCDESLAVQKKFFAKDEYKHYTFPQAIDTQNRMKKKLNVFGVPHAILLEPSEGVVIWEGFPLLPGHELTDKIIDDVLAIGRKSGDLPVRK